MNSKKKYIQNLKKQFHAVGKEEHRFLDGLLDRIDTFEQFHPKASYSNYTEEFGTPEEILSEYYENAGNSNLLRKIKLTKYVKLIFATIVLFFVVYAFLIAKTQLEIQKSYPHHDEIIITVKD